MILINKNLYPSKFSCFKFILLPLLICGFFFSIDYWNIASGQEQKWLLSSNDIEGSRSKELVNMLNDIAVQRTLLDIASKPRSRGYINSALQGTNISLEQLLKNKLIRFENDLYVINYLLFTRADIKIMREITESHAKILSDAILKRRSEIETILKQYVSPGVDPHAVIYIIVGCFSLDWDGLELTADRGYRSKKTLLKRIFSRSIFWSWEGIIHEKELYKGSHSNKYGIAVLTSFGDHEIQPREFLPDILDFSNRYHLYPYTLKEMIESVTKTSSKKAIGKQIGVIMLALREGNKNITELSKAADIEQEEADKLLRLLIKLGYIEQIDIYYNARVPVLTLTDSLIVEEIRRIGREEMENYFDQNYGTLCKELSKLTPFRYGVEQEDFFYNLWHYIFGATNRNLVKAGLFADPYSELYGSKGVIPVVYHRSLHKH